MYNSQVWKIHMHEQGFQQNTCIYMKWLAAWWFKGKLLATQALSETQKNVS